MTVLSKTAWTSVTTTTVDTLFQSKRGRILVTTTNPNAGGFDEEGSSVELTDHTQMRGLFVVPAGLTVWAKAITFNVGVVPTISFIPFGL